MAEDLTTVPKGRAKPTKKRVLRKKSTTMGIPLSVAVIPPSVPLPRKNGRPSKMTPQVILKLEAVFAVGGSDLEACLFADITKTALYNYQKSRPEFLERKEKLKERPTLIARQSVVKGMQDDANLALKYLERRRPTEFAVRRELTGADGKELPQPLFGGLSITANEINVDNSVTEVSEKTGE